MHGMIGMMALPVAINNIQLEVPHWQALPVASRRLVLVILLL